MTSLLPAQLHFLHPHWLWLLAGLPVVLWLTHWRQQRRQALTRLVDNTLIAHVTSGKAGRNTGQLLLVAAIWLLACLALAGPSWKQYPQTLQNMPAAQIIAVALPPTLKADDMSPNRLAHLRFKVHDLLRANRAGLNGLVGFAGEAFVIAPLTRDSHSLSALVDAMGPDTMPVKGINAAHAIKRSQTLLSAAGVQHGLIVLFTDRANQAAIKAARHAAKAGMRVSVLTLGDKRPLTLKDGSLLHDSHGKLALTALNNRRLSAIAHAGGGDYVKGRLDSGDIKQIEAGLTAGKRQQGRSVKHWQDMGPWLLLPLLLLFALGFRRGWLLLLVIMPLALPHPAVAASWQQHWNNLWQTPDQQAAAALASGQAKLAERLAKSPDWKGAAAYQSGDYKTAASAYRQLKSADGHYNLGNALAKSGHLKAAIKAYETALKQAPDNQDAKTNLARVKKRLEQQQQQKRQHQQHNKSGGKHQKKGAQGRSSSSPKHPGKTNSKRQDKPHHKGSESNKHSPSRSSASQHKPAQSTSQGKRSQAAKRAQNKPTHASKAHSATAPSKAQQNADKQATDKATKALAKQLKQSPRKPPINNLGALPNKGPKSPLSEANKQLLQSVPDQPGALLQRKFELQYQQRKARGEH